MNIKPLLWAVGLTALSSSVMAQGFSGGELTIDAYSYSESDDSGNVSYSAALEYALNRQFSLAADIGIYDFSLLDESVNTLTIHSVYHLSDQASLGFFTGFDELAGETSSFYGIEGGYEVGQFEMEGHLTVYDNSANTTILGASGAYEITQSISAIGALGFGDFDDEDVTRISAGAEYEFASGPSVYAEIGNLSLGDEDSGFIGIGASVQFGADRGTTFDRRGVFATLLPGL